jgi:outer membrane protein assembly factor BamB
VAFDGRSVYVGSYDGHLYALDARTGRLRWRASAQGSFLGNATFYATPAVAYGRVYVGATDGKMYSFGAATGKLRWSHGTGGYVYSSAAVWRERILVGSYSGWFYAFDAATGNVRWRFRANGPISGSPTVLDGIVYFATLKERTYALDARTGKPVWSFPDGKYSPVVADRHRLYLVGYARVYGLVPRYATPLTRADVLAALRRAHALQGTRFRVLKKTAAARYAARKLHGARVCNVAIRFGPQGRPARRALALLLAACEG